MQLIAICLDRKSQQSPKENAVKRMLLSLVVVSAISACAKLDDIVASARLTRVCIRKMCLIR